MTYPSGRVLSYTYDSSGRVNTIGSRSSTEGSELIASNITRLPFGPVEKLALGNGIERKREYDQDYRIESMLESSAFSRNFKFDTINNITAITDSIVPDNSQLMTYDELYRLDFATGTYGERTYAYDEIGNRQSLTSLVEGNTKNETYEYENQSHRLTSVVSDRVFQYDAVGNTINNGKSTFNYNDRNRMSSAVANGVTTEYQQNALGQRVLKRNDSAEVHYLYDLNGMLIAESNADGTIAVEYAYMDEEPLVMWRDDNRQVKSPSSLPERSTPIAPNAQVTSATPTFTWQNLSNATTYQLRVYDRTVAAGVLNAQYSAKDICTDDVCTIKPANLTMGVGANHMWVVRGGNTVGWGKWSRRLDGVFSYAVANSAGVSIVAPTGEIGVSENEFTWSALNGATEYKVFLYDRDERDVIYIKDHIASQICLQGKCSITPAGITLQTTHRYIWSVKAKDASGWGVWSPATRFSVAGGQ